MTAHLLTILLVIASCVCSFALTYSLLRVRQRKLIQLAVGAGQTATPTVQSDRPIGRREVEQHIPNALDLMQVCIEAGLDLNNAMARVGVEFRESAPALSRLFSEIQLQVNAGATREQAFEAFASELGSVEIRNLMVSLAEAERFGSSVSVVLRTYSSELRMRRRLKAEELGAKLPTKLLFPLLICLFPAMLVVLAGPSILAAMELVTILR